MIKPRLLLITNQQNTDPEEDQYLANYLQKSFSVTLCSLTEAIVIAPNFDGCLVRNAWPSRLFKAEFKQFQKMCLEKKIRLYNPIHRNGYVEDKNYLVELYKVGYPVIPAVRFTKELDQLPATNEYLIKPLDGASAWGVEVMNLEQLLSRNPLNHIIQQKLHFQDEISFYFIDDHLTYTLVSSGPNQRWDLTEYSPTATEIDWAQKFVNWNQLPFGLQRIDACRMANGELLLMEIEAMMPFLSLDALNEDSRQRVCRTLEQSLLKNLA